MGHFCVTTYDGKTPPERKRDMSASYRRKWFHAGAIIRQRGNSFQVEINQHGKRHRSTVETLAEAKSYAESKGLELKNRGAQAFILTDKTRVDALAAMELLDGATSLENAARFWLRHNRPAGASVTMQELLKLFITTKLRANRRPDTLIELENKLGRFAGVDLKDKRNGEERHISGDFETRQVHTITITEIERWLNDHTETPRNRNKYRTLFHGLFQYAVKMRLLDINPVAAIERSTEDETMPECYSVGEVEKLLRTAEHQAPELIPYLATGFFAGLRPSEAAKLDWGKVDIVNRIITLDAAITKKRRMRHATMSDNLLAWLLPYRRNEGSMIPEHHRFLKLWATLIKESELTRVIPSGLRHTFASMHLALHESADKTSHQMGHRKDDVLFEHYRKLVSRQEAENFWGILPMAIGAKNIASPLAAAS